VQLVCIVVPRVVRDPKTFHRCIALIARPPLVILVKGLFMLVVIRSEFCNEYQTRPKFHANRDQSDLSILNFFF
jgi:hypothetical protein